MKKAVLFLFIVPLFFSCSSFIYYPNGANAPLLTEKGETRIGLAFKGFGGDIRTAYAVNDHLGVQFNANLLNVTNTELGTHYRNGNCYAEGAAGFFRPLTRRIVFEAYAGAGTGVSFSENLDSGTRRRSRYHKLYLQQNIGLKGKLIDFGLALREAYVNVYRTEYNGTGTEEYSMDLFLEPVLFLGIGFEKFRISAQAGISDSQFSWINSYPPFIVSAGIESRFTFK